MLYLIIIRVALKSLLANRLRSFLAMLGIIIGVAAVISMLAFGAGAQKQVLDQIQTMGANLLIVRAGQAGVRGVAGGGSVQSLRIEDAQAILAEVKGVQLLSPVVQGSGQFKYMNKNSRSSILGGAVTYFPIRNYEVEKGRMFTESQVERAARVVILGAHTASELFGEQDPIGERVKINSVNFEVLGVLKSKGDQGWYNPDDQGIIPYTTAMKQVLGVDYIREIDVQIDPKANQQAVQTAIETLLRKRHKIRTGQLDDFHVRNVAEMVDAAAAATNTFRILLGSVAAISLIVGGIGIMNIMLVTVTERTREIGVRKAIGARDRDILFQFLVEAVIMSGLGGLIGLGLGVGGAMLAARLTQFEVLVETSSVVMAIVFSAVVGVFFGFYPARRAAQLDPIDALQYE